MVPIIRHVTQVIVMCVLYQNKICLANQAINQLSIRYTQIITSELRPVIIRVVAVGILEP